MSSKIILVGEAWGAQEARVRHAFVGRSGRELAAMLAGANLAPPVSIPFPNEMQMIQHWRRLRREHGIAVANVFDAHPMMNDIGEFFSREGSHDLPGFRQASTVSFIRPEHMHHILRLWDFIRSERPNVVVALGNTACWALLGQTKITTLRGTIQWSDRLQTKVLPTYHPAAILRQWSMRPVTIADLTKARRESEFPEIRRKERWIIIPTPDTAGISEIAAWLDQPALVYANDIETAFGQISMLSFARNEADALVIPFHANAQGESFWPTAELEVQAWRLAIQGLKRRIPKIGQNWIYDLGYYLRMGILPHVGNGDDTMLRHHSRYPELPKGLGFLGSLYSDEIAWKLMAKSPTFKRDE